MSTAATHSLILEAEQELRDIKVLYVKRWGWECTCNTPGSYWLWKRDFAVEDAARHKTWKDRGPGPLGWSSEPRPYGVMSADLDLAVSMTVKCLDDQPELSDEECEG